MKKIGAVSIVVMLLIIGIIACGSKDSVTTPSPDQYKEVAVRYLRALTQGDFKTFLELDIAIRDRLANVRVPEQPAFDRQQRMQTVMNDVNRQIREEFDSLVSPIIGPNAGKYTYGFNTTQWAVSHLIGATSFKVVEVGPIEGGVVEVYIEVQGREKNVFFVPVVSQNGNLGVTRSIGIYGKSTRSRLPGVKLPGEK